MIVTKISGGLGNQMFQYAIAKSLSNKKCTNLKLDLSFMKKYRTHPFILDKFSLSYQEFGLFLSELFFYRKGFFSLIKFIPWLYNKTIKEKSLLYDSSVESNIADSFYLDGYWQSEKYFYSCREQLLKDFKVDYANLDDANLEMLERIKHTASVSVHVRRGDYIDCKVTKKIHGSCSNEYYQKAISYISLREENPVFYIFSDDNLWVSNEFIKGLNMLVNVVVVDINDVNNGYLDINLMRNCKHNIIANSSFSWWGAWLNEYKNKMVIAPEKWFANELLQNQSMDIVPEGWLRL